MTERDFAYWLQGALELAGVEALTTEQASTIRGHAALVRDGGLFTGQVIALVGVSIGKELVDHVRPVVDGYFTIVTRNASIPVVQVPHPNYGEPRRYC